MLIILQVTALDRLTGGVTVIVHTDCDMPQALINRVENSFADVYFTPHWQHSLYSQYQKPLAQIVNQFMSKIQVPAVEKHRTALEAAFGIKSIANKNLPNYDHNPATLVPSQLLKINLPTSPWRGRGAPSTVAEPEVHITAVPGVGSHNPTTPPRFATTTVPSFPTVEVPWGGLNAKLPTGNVTGVLADIDSSSPAVQLKLLSHCLQRHHWTVHMVMLSGLHPATSCPQLIRHLPPWPRFILIRPLHCSLHRIHHR